MPELLFPLLQIAWNKLTPFMTLLQLLICNLLAINVTSVPGASISTDIISNNADGIDDNEW